MNRRKAKLFLFNFEKFIHSDENKVEKFVLTGGGFGHGVGMSQYGAGYMAQMGKKYDDILKHYYSGIALGTMQKEALYNPYNLEYKTEFYYKKSSGESVILKVINPKKVSSLNFKINENSFNPDMTGYSAKTLGMDITKYLVNGVNQIVFSPLSEKDKNKSVIFQVEIGNKIGK